MNEELENVSKQIDEINDCEWYEVKTAIVGTRDVMFCANPDNLGGTCTPSKCPLIEDWNDA